MPAPTCLPASSFVFSAFFVVKSTGRLPVGAALSTPKVFECYSIRRRRRMITVVRLKANSAQVAGSGMARVTSTPLAR